MFKIISESSLASGVRRIEAITGEKAFLYVRDKIDLIEHVKNILTCNEEDIIDKATSATALNKKLKKEIMMLNTSRAKEYFTDSIQENLIISNKIKVLIDNINFNLSPQLLSDIVREKLSKQGIGLIGVRSDENNFVLCVITRDFNSNIHAGKIIEMLTAELGVGGGGSQYMAVMKINNDLSIEKVLKIGKQKIQAILKAYDK